MFGCNLSVIDGTENILYRDDSIELPEKFSLKGNLPEVLNQGSDPICVPCSISSYIDWNKSIHTGEAKSCNTDLYEIYDNKEVEGEGMTFKEAFKFLEEKGASTDDEIRFKVKSYSKIGTQIVLKQAIVSNGPCLGVLPVYNTSEKNFWEKNIYDTFQGFHAISIIGYDKNGFIIRNSWGERFGVNGYTYLPNKDFNNLKELWTIIR